MSVRGLGKKSRTTSANVNRIMDKIFAFENLVDNSVNKFNEMFYCRLPFNVDDEVEILEPFTSGGRYIKIGDREPVKHMFRKPLTGYETKSNWKAIYEKGKLLGIFKTAVEFAKYHDCQLSKANDIISNGKYSDKYLVLELFE